MLSAWGRTFGADTGFMPLYGRIDKLLDASGHVGGLVRPQSIQLVCGRLGGADVLRRRGIHGVIGPEQVGDGRAVLSDRA